MNMSIPLGFTVTTAGIAEWIAKAPNPDIRNTQIMQCLYKHSKGDWGLVDEEDWETNNQAVKNGQRLVSAYEIDGSRIWIITEWDRSVTTVLFPHEY